MAGIDQYLRITIGEMEYLLHSSASLAIEQQESLLVNAENGNVTAWRKSGSGRWPAYSLGPDLRPAPRRDWERAVFINAAPTPVGLIADEIQLLPQAEVQVEPFTPLGPPPTRNGHVFAGVWVSQQKLVLVFEPAGFAAYLHSLGE